MSLLFFLRRVCHVIGCIQLHPGTWLLAHRKALQHIESILKKQCSCVYILFCTCAQYTPCASLPVSGQRHQI